MVFKIFFVFKFFGCFIELFWELELIGNVFFRLVKDVLFFEVELKLFIYGVLVIGLICLLFIFFDLLYDFL